MLVEQSSTFFHQVIFKDYILSFRFFFFFLMQFQAHTSVFQGSWGNTTIQIFQQIDLMYKMDLLSLLLPLMDHPTVQIRVNQTLKNCNLIQYKRRSHCGHRIPTQQVVLIRQSDVCCCNYQPFIMQGKEGSCEKH